MNRERSTRRTEDDDRPARGRRDESRDDPPARPSRDRDEEPVRSRSRGDAEDRGAKGGGSSYRYQERSAESTKARASKGANDFDKIIKDGIRSFKVNDGDNRIRILPPTWKNPEHYGYDIYVNYGVGADRGQYLSLHKMLEQPDPINEEREQFKRDMNPDSKEDQAYLKELEAKRRVGVYLIDRDNEKEGVQFWAMPWTVDRDIIKVSVDKATGEVLPIDHPEEGYDVTFEKKGAKDRTEYIGMSVARRSSPLGNDKWLDFAVENPIPDILNYFDYNQIAKAFGGKTEHKEKSRGRDDEEPAAKGRGRDEPEDKVSLTWDSIHEMTKREMKDLIEDEDLDIEPKEAKDDEDLADWICDELKITKSEKKPSGRRVVDDDPEEDSAAEKLRKLRNRRDD